MHYANTTYKINKINNRPTDQKLVELTMKGLVGELTGVTMHHLWD